MSVTTECPIWGADYEATLSGEVWTEARTDEPDITEKSLIDSDRAGGAYRITVQALSSIRNNRLSDIGKAQLTTWLVDQRRQGNAEPIVTDEVVKSFESRGAANRLPVFERAVRLLRFLIDQTGRVGDSVSIPRHWLAAGAWSESTDVREVLFLLDYVEKRGWLKNITVSGDYVIYDVTVTVEGYSRIEEIASNPDSAQVFVAMWFDNEMQEAYDNGIEPAIRDGGFEPMRIDRKQDVIKIDDEILSEIRRSRFLVADMTHGEGGARGGVYFEAGFALGLDIPVLFTCRSDKVDELHFDTRQYFHIVWSNPEELRADLANRIGAIIGDGPYRGRRNESGDGPGD